MAAPSSGGDGPRVVTDVGVPADAVVAVGPFTWAPPAAGAWLTPARARWALERLWAIAGGGAGWSTPPCVTIRGCPDAVVAHTLGAAAGTAPRRDIGALLPPGATRHAEGTVPVLFGAGPDAVVVQADGNGGAVCAVDLAALTFFMLTRWEEAQGAARDTRGRFPASASLALRQGFLDTPVVDDWAMILRAWIAHLAPAFRPVPQPFRFRLTCDVDVLRRHETVGAVARDAAAALVRGRGPGAALRTLRTGLASRAAWRSDPYFAGLVRILGAAERHGQRAAFYFKTSDPGPYDSGYSFNDEVAVGFLDEVRRRGHEIGFHPGWDTFRNPPELAKEKARLDAVTGGAKYGGRQHNLRFEAPTTWRHWEALGLTYDSTLGYADRAGFRCGTCHPYPVFDFEQERVLALMEVPLIVMDATLRGAAYEALSPEAATARITQLGNRCLAVGGTFMLLWHNSSFTGAYHGWDRVFETAVDTFAPLHDRGAERA